LNISLEIEGDCKNKLIVPLLLIPFVENSFKHGSSKMLQHSWIKLKIIIKENVLHMDLNNSKPFQVASQGGRNGIGLKNVQKRLQLLYPGRNVLIIGSTDEEFSVHMQIPLEQIYIKGMPAKTLQQIIPVSQSPSYA
jgi:LytS/YehU family sensor histidine kinase